MKRILSLSTARLRLGAWPSLAVLLLVGCHKDQLPDGWTLTANGVEVDVSRAPYGYVLKDDSGRTVLSTLSDGDGYDGVASAEGQTYWENLGSPGYFTFQLLTDGFDGDWTVIDAHLDGAGQADAEQTDTSLTLVLVPAGDVDDKGRVDDAAPRMDVVHTVRDGVLRVDASMEGDAPRAWSVGFSSPSDEGFLGFGERFDKTNQRGVPVYSWLEEGGIGTGEGDVAGPDNPAPNGQAMAYAPVPWFLSTEGYGFWLDTTWRSQFELATERDDAWRVWETGPELAYEVYVPSTADDRPWTHQLLDKFTETVGRPAVPSPWAFGPRRRISWDYQVDGKPEIQAMRDEDLALTTADDSVHFLPNGSQVGREQGLADWVASANALGANVVAYYNGLFNADPASPIADVTAEGVQKGYFVLKPDGTPSTVWLISGSPETVYTLDFTNPDAVAWYQAMFQWAIDLGYKGWMYDFGEYIQPDDVLADGETGEQFHNEFPVLYQKALRDALESSSIAGDWLVFSRSGYTGSSQYDPVMWSGDPAASFEDSDGLPSMIRGEVNAGMSGFANWGGDIGGFHCIADGASAADDELLARWIEQGSMGSDMHDEDACSGNLDGTKKANIWTAPDAKAAWATYARLHTRLFPYLYALATEAHEDGLPVARHLFLEHPDQRALADVDDAYYVGPSLLAAPVVERGARTKTVTLPTGRYLDWVHDVVYDGGQDVTVDAPLTVLPLFLRDGAVVPMLDPSIDTLVPGVHGDVVGPDDVADVYDVVGFSADHGGSFQLADGGTLVVDWSGGLQAPTLDEVDESELATCDGCWRQDDLGNGLVRVRISSSAGEVNAGGLRVVSTVPRRIRWDLYLVE